MYIIEVEHRGLNKHRAIRGRDRAVVERKAELQCAAWDEEWEAKSARQAAQANKEAKAAEAAARTEDAKRAIDEVSSILSHTLQVDDLVDWESLKRSFSEPASPPRKPSMEHFAPTLRLLDHLFPSRKRRKIQAGRTRYDQAIQQWRLALQRQNAEAEALQRMISEHNAIIEAQRLRYLHDDPEAIAEYCDLVLSRSSYPIFFPHEFQVDYNKSIRTVVVDYRLPSPSDMPTLKETRYIANRDEFRDTYLAEREIEALYNGAICQIALRTIHELFEADEIDAIDAVVFNGWVHYVDPRSGKDTNACIASLQATKCEFQQINLAAVDPRAYSYCVESAPVIRQYWLRSGEMSSCRPRSPWT